MARYKVNYEKFGVNGDEFRARAHKNYSKPSQQEMREMAEFIRKVQAGEIIPEKAPVFRTF